MLRAPAGVHASSAAAARLTLGRWPGERARLAVEALCRGVVSSHGLS
jgi:hypothetical protein